MIKINLNIYVIKILYATKNQTNKQVFDNFTNSFYRSLGFVININKDCDLLKSLSTEYSQPEKLCKHDIITSKSQQHSIKILILT